MNNHLRFILCLEDLYWNELPDLAKEMSEIQDVDISSGTPVSEPGTVADHS